MIYVSDVSDAQLTEDPPTGICKNIDGIEK